jgi:16S rRNA processing protein RimM
MSDTERRILLGRIAAAHGIRGDLLIETYTREPDGIATYGAVQSEDGTHEFKLKILRTTPKGVIAHAKGVDDRNAAEALRGTSLYVARDRLPPPEDDEFYQADLVGLRAEDEHGQEIGKVVAVQNYGAGNILELRKSGQRATELIPFTQAFVPTVDVAGGRVVIVAPLTTSDDEKDGEENR